MSVCLCPINVKTAEPIGQKLCVGPHMTPGNVYEWSKLASNKIRFSLNFENPQKKLWNPRTLFVLFYNVYKEKMVSIEIEKEAPWNPSKNKSQ